MKLIRVLELIETKNSWGKDQLKLAILNMLAEDIELKETAKPGYSLEAHE